MGKFKEQEKRLVLAPGTLVEYGGRQFGIAQILDLEYVLATDMQTQEIKKLPIGQLQPADEDHSLSSGGEDLLNISDEDWHEAQRRFEIIQPLLADKFCSRDKVAARAAEADVNTATVYRWMRRYRAFGRVSSLVPLSRGPRVGSARLHPEVEAIIVSAIQDKYLNRQTSDKRERKSKQPRKRGIQAVVDEVERLCRNAKLTAPHPSTVRRWIARLSERDKMRGEKGAAVAEEAFSGHRGKFPDGHWPLHVVQIDHTLLNIILVDDIQRRPVGRPWITLAIDIFSRMITGFYVSFDPPGNLSVGLCIARSILPKEAWMLQLGVKGSWPLWGKMQTIHADNAGEFRGKMLKKACEEYGLDLTWRPVKKPRYGAHIERLLGNFNSSIHDLEGSTYSNPKEKGNYDPEKDASMSLSEFERWLAELIINRYHLDKHRGLGGFPPISRYEEGIFGNKEIPGIGLPERILDESRLRLDLMPFERRTVQRHGIVWDNIKYYSDVLRPWIGAMDPDNRGKKRKFIVRRDPRNISCLYFFDPELKQYFEIPYRNLSHPSISLWELREIRRWMKAQGIAAVDEEAIFAARERMLEIENKAKKETKKVRRMKQRRRGWQKAEKPQLAASNHSSLPPESNLRSEVKPFEEMEELDDGD